MELRSTFRPRCSVHGKQWEEWLCRSESKPSSGSQPICIECGLELQRMRAIQQAIRNLPVAEFPNQWIENPLLIAPKTTRHEAHRPRDRRRRRRWADLPWGLRTTLEGSAIVGLILGLVLLGPQLRKLYERSVERSIEKYSDSMGILSNELGEGGDASDPNQKANQIPLVRGGRALPSGGDAADDYTSEAGSEGEDVAVEEPNSAKIRVPTRPEIWRFHIKSSTPKELRKQIVALFLSAGLSADSPGVGGIEAPGGIQFNLLLSSVKLPQFRADIEKLAPPRPTDLEPGSPMGETFTWIRSKSKTPLPAGKVRVVVWISQY